MCFPSIEDHWVHKGHGMPKVEIIQSIASKIQIKYISMFYQCFAYNIMNALPPCLDSILNSNNYLENADWNFFFIFFLFFWNFLSQIKIAKRSTKPYKYFFLQTCKDFFECISCGPRFTILLQRHRQTTLGHCNLVKIIIINNFTKMIRGGGPLFLFGG